MEACNFCQDRRCDGCPLPYTESATYSDLLAKIGINSNVSFYPNFDTYKRGKHDVIFEVVWNSTLPEAFFSKFISARHFENTDGTEGSEEAKESASVTLGDCLEEFSKPE